MHEPGCIDYRRETATELVFDAILPGAAYGIDDAAKLNDAAIARALNDATVMHGNGRGDQVAPECPQSSKRPLFVGTGKLAVSGYIRRKNGRELPSLRHIRPFTTRETSTNARRPGQDVSPAPSLPAKWEIRASTWTSGVGCSAWASNSTRPRSAKTDIDATVLPNLTAEDLKDLAVRIVGHRRKLLDAIGLVGTDAKAKAALAILPEFDGEEERWPSPSR